MSQKIKIAHILHSVGGVDVSARIILNNLDTDKFNSIVIHGKKDTSETFTDKKSNPVKDYRVPIEREINLLKDIKSILQIIRILKYESPDLIHGHSAKGGVVAKLVGWYLKIPVLHTPQAFSYLSTKNKKRDFYILIEKVLKNIGRNKILASSNSEKQRALNDIGYPKNRIILFNNSIRPIESIPNLSIEPSWPKDYICSVGRPSFQKNIELMIKILFRVKQEVPDIHLVLMGVGYHSPNLDEIKEQIKLNGLGKNITLLNWTSRSDIFNIIHNSKFYISTARYEGLPYSIIESLSIGKPIIATDADGNKDLIKDGYNGYLFSQENENGYSSKIIELWKDKDKINELSTNSKTLFEEHFNVLKTIKRLEQIYSSESKR